MFNWKSTSILICVAICLFSTTTSAEDEQCYQISECLLIAGIESYNTENWPLNICSGELLGCFVKAKDACGPKVDKFIKYIDTVCSCTNALVACEPAIKTMFKVPAKIYEIPSYICSKLPAVTKCIKKSAEQYSCPESVMRQYNRLVEKVEFDCSNKGCIDSWGNCAKKSFEIFEMASKKIKLDDLGYESLKSICDNLDTVKNCFSEGKGEKCDVSVINGWTSGIQSVKQVCQLLDCYKEVSQCASPYVVDLTKLANDTMCMPKLQNVVESVCGKNKENAEECLESEKVASICPVEFNNSIQKVKPKFDRACQMMQCRSEIQTCSDSFVKDMVVEIKNNEISIKNPNLKLICENMDDLQECFNEDTPSCKGPTRKIFQDFEMIKQYCQSKCLPKIESCTKVILESIFKKSNNYYTDDQCNSNTDMKKCFKELKLCEETVPMSKFIIPTCKVIVCVNAMNRCGGNLVEGLKEVTFSKKGIEKVCSNIKETEECLAVHGNTDCIDNAFRTIVPEMQTKIMQTCSRLIDMTHPKIPQITEKEFVTLSLRLDLKWTLSLYDMASSDSLKLKKDMQATLKELFKSDKDIVSVNIAKFYEGSIGVIYSVKYSKQLEQKEVLLKSNKLASLAKVSSILVGNKKVKVLGDPIIILKNKKVHFTGEPSCEVMTAVGACLNNGKCIIESHKPVCQCTDEFSGSFCEKSKTITSSATSVVLSTLVMSIATIVASMLV